MYLGVCVYFFYYSFFIFFLYNILFLCVFAIFFSFMYLYLFFLPFHSLYYSFLYISLSIYCYFFLLFLSILNFYQCHFFSAMHSYLTPIYSNTITYSIYSQVKPLHSLYSTLYSTPLLLLHPYKFSSSLHSFASLFSHSLMFLLLILFVYYILLHSSPTSFSLYPSHAPPYSTNPYLFVLFSTLLPVKE